VGAANNPVGDFERRQGNSRYGRGDTGKKAGAGKKEGAASRNRRGQGWEGGGPFRGNRQPRGGNGADQNGRGGGPQRFPRRVPGKGSTGAGGGALVFLPTSATAKAGTFGMVDSFAWEYNGKVGREGPRGEGLGTQRQGKRGAFPSP